MLYFQKWPVNTFEYKFLKKVEKIINKQNNYKMYFGFDYGYFLGINIYYGSNHSDKLALKLKDKLQTNKGLIRLCTNIPYDFDLIVLFGYSNLRKQRLILRKKQKIILKALSKL